MRSLLRALPLKQPLSIPAIVTIVLRAPVHVLSPSNLGLVYKGLLVAGGRQENIYSAQLPGFETALHRGGA
jgi:hypothetical protein